MFTLPVRSGPGADEGDRIALDALRGRVVVLDFWASWCGPCGESMPILNRVAERFHGRPVELVGINVEPALSPVEVAAAHRRFGSVLPTVQDETGGLQEAYGVRNLPTIVVIDRDGRIADRRVGIPVERFLVAKIDSLLD